MTLHTTPHITEDALVPSADGRICLQLVQLLGGRPGRIWLVYNRRQPTVRSEYYIEVFDLSTASWQRLHEIQPAAVGLVFPRDLPARMQEVADELFTAANAVLAAAETAERR
ncbi:hypothetical protein [Nocardia abscessus]|uniref:hypothetical protein n=1 Tax=Nocardia abscessus TaxID=120957 RepID=UPI0024559F10|nr:hypothetical protein [Nocardia abscessus]